MALPALPEAHVALVVPERRVSTAEAYRALGAVVELPAPSALVGPDHGDGWAAAAGAQRNDFESVVFPSAPELAAVRNLLAEAGAVVARMTGSGSAIFGVFEDETAAERAGARASAMPGVREVRVAPTLTGAHGLVEEIGGRS